MNDRGTFPGKALWFLALGPAAWLAHFLLFYSAAAIVCARAGVGADALAVPGALATAGALAMVAAVALRGHRARAFNRARETAGPRRGNRFLGGLLLGIAAVCTAGIIVTASLPFVIGACR